MPAEKKKTTKKPTVKAKNELPKIDINNINLLPCFEPIEEISKLHGLTPLSHDEAITALKAGEHLVNGIDNYDVAHYHLFGTAVQ